MNITRIYKRFQDWQKAISNLRYTDDIVLLPTPPEELQDLVSHVNKAAQEYKMIISAAKTKVITNTSQIIEVIVDGGKLEQVDLFGT